MKGRPLIEWCVYVNDGRARLATAGTHKQLVALVLASTPLEACMRVWDGAPDPLLVTGVLPRAWSHAR